MAEPLEEWLRAQRWFGAKAADTSHVGVLEEIPLRDGLRCLLVEVRFNSGVHDLYQLIAGSGTAYDALDDPATAFVLAKLLESGAGVGDVQFTWTGVAGALPETPSVRPMGAEQSNSTIVLDDALALKVFRRLQPGENPELEMLRFLSEHGFANIAPLAGWYAFEGERLSATLGVLQTFLTDGVDGWDYALSAPEEFLGRAVDLGAVTGRMHSVLASDGADADFAPEVPGDEALGMLVATIDEEIDRVFLDLRDGDDAVLPIMGRGEELRDRLAALSHQSAGGRLIRHHGDYHLGQTLLSGSRWVILDFEGEPARSLPERRRKRSPLRDAAGMLRSFAYAASARSLPTGWEAAARQRFLDGYFEAIDPALLPAGQAAVAKLLAIHELEKAVYELRYELNNRPDWVRIPVAAIARLLDDPMG